MKWFKVKLFLFLFFINSLNALEIFRISKENIQPIEDLKQELYSNIKWYRFNIPQDITYHCFYFSEIKQIFEVYEIEDSSKKGNQLKKIYQYGELENPKYLGNPFHIICSNQKVLYFRIYYFDLNRIGIIGTILAGNKDSFYRYIIKKEFIDLVLGIMYILTGLLTFILFLFNKKYKLFLHFSIFIFFLGLASFTTNNIKYIYIENALFWSWINVFSLSFITSYSLIFVSSLVENKFKKFLTYFGIIQIIIAFTLFILAIKDSYILYYILLFYAYLVIINSIIALVYILINVMKKDKKAIILFLGILILSSGAILDSMTLIKLLEYNSLYFNISMFLFLVILIFLLIQYQRDSLKKLERIEIEFDLAFNVHKKLLPTKVPQHEKIKILYDYNPSYYLSGDFIHFNEIENNKIGIFLGDISGHGISSALYSSTVYHLIHMLKDYYLKPAKFLSIMNHFLCDYLNSDFITAVYLIIDLEKNEFVYCSAGHTDILYFLDHKIILLGQTGPALGVKYNAQFQEYKYQILNNSMLMLYTDGFIEIFDKKRNLLTIFDFIYKMTQLKSSFLQDQKVNIFNLYRKQVKKSIKGDFLDDQAGIIVYFNK